jgi:hypothetical protein
MVWFVVMEIFSTLLEWVRLGQKSETEKALEILLLRRQLAIVGRTLDKPVRPSRGEKLTLAEGELIKLGYDLSDETVANILKRQGIPPVLERRATPAQADDCAAHSIFTP